MDNRLLAKLRDSKIIDNWSWHPSFDSTVIMIKSGTYFLHVDDELDNLLGHFERFIKENAIIKLGDQYSGFEYFEHDGCLVTIYRKKGKDMQTTGKEKIDALARMALKIWRMKCQKIK